MFKITNILNPLTGGATTEEYVWEKGKPLSEYMGFDGECVVAYNREIIPLPLDKIFPADTDEYVVMPMVAGVDRQSQRLLGYSAMTAVSFIPGWGPAAAYLGSVAISLFLKDKEINQSMSESYAWQHRNSPTAAHGLPMPIIYGKARVRPALKNRYVTIDGDRQMLYALYGIAAHKVDERTGVATLSDAIEGLVGGGEEFTHPSMLGATLVYPLVYNGPDPNNIPAVAAYLADMPFGKGMASFHDDITIDGRAIEDFDKDVEWETRPGLSEQTVVLDFDVTYTHYVLGEMLYLDYPEIVKEAANFRIDTDAMVVSWDEHQLLLRGESYTIKADEYVLTPAMLPHTVHLIFDKAVSEKEYQKAYGNVTLPGTAYDIFTFRVDTQGWYDKKYPYGTNMPVADDWYEPGLKLTNAHDIQLIFEFPFGLYGVTTTGETVNASCRVFAQYREYTDSDTESWIDFEFGFATGTDYKITNTDPSAGAITRSKPQNFHISVNAKKANEVLGYGKTYEIRVAASSPSIIKLTNVATVVYGEENADRSAPGFTYPGEPLLGIKALASGQISGDLDVQVDVERSQVWVYNTRHAKTLTTSKITLYASGNYIRIKGYYGDWNDFQVGQFITISGAVVSGGANNGVYKISRKVAFEVMGFERLYLDSDYSTITINENGAMTTQITLTATGLWVEGPADNHAWAVYDILAQGHPDHPAYPTAGNEDAEAIYGCGVDKDRLDYESFREWADNIETLDYELNIVFDTFMTAWDAILRVCQEGRGMVYPVGSKIYAFTDKAADATQLFTMGNIHTGTFVQKFMESNQKINMIEANYYDRERNYEKTTLAARTEDWDSSEMPSIPVTITLYGTTTFDQAWATARFILMGNELLNNAISFGVDIDALAAQAGDVVEVQHDVLNAGRGGRIVKYEENPISNPSFETDFSSWVNWGTATRIISTARKYSGDKAYYHTGAVENGGISQTITGLKASTQYTLSCYTYPHTDTSLRIMTKIGSAYPSKHPAGLNAWERLEFTVTTEPGQTTLTIWLGGEGSAYFDAVQVEEAAAVTDWMQQARVTLDREVTLAGDDELIVWRSGTRITKTTSLNTGETRDSLNYSTVWTVPPQQYDVYSFGDDSDTIVNKYRITDISRTSELMRTLTLVQYDADLYDSYVPSDPESEAGWDGGLSKPAIRPPSDTTETVKELINKASNVQLQETFSENRKTGTFESSILATWDVELGNTRGTWEIWFRDVDAIDIDWQGTWAAEGKLADGAGYEQGDKVELDGKTYISLEDDNKSTPVSV